jgi:hypothetical protein
VEEEGRGGGEEMEGDEGVEEEVEAGNKIVGDEGAQPVQFKRSGFIIN